MRRIRAVVTDFGGVLTSPLFEAFAAFQRSSGISLEALGRAMARVAEREGAHPLFELEKGRMSESDFLAKLGDAVGEEIGRPVTLEGFSERYFARLRPNDELIDYMRSLRERGLRLAILTNNVREWEQRWRAFLPIDEIFDLVVDSAFVGMRKPEREIFELTLERLGVAAQESVFVDDIEINCQAAAELGMTAIHFQDNAQAIAAIDAALADGGAAAG